jgi:hypothetical protein
MDVSLIHTKRQPFLPDMLFEGMATRLTTPNGMFHAILNLPIST